jgi:oligopeptide/dipeptide ABC transporter ATP-binding protein
MRWMFASMTNTALTSQSEKMDQGLRPVLSVRHLNINLKTDSGVVAIVKNVSFDIHPGQTLALVGESGAGKSITSLAIMRLVGRGGNEEGAHVSGEILLETEHGIIDLLQAPISTIQMLRGKALSMVFQEPMTSLNPVFRVGWQIAEAIVTHEKLSWAAAEARALDMLKLVGIPDPLARMRAFPHELSGGMRQRIMVAMALACRPSLLIADEPTTALDVTVQAQVLNLIKRLQSEFGIGMLFITHDLGVVAQMADTVAVMYAGSIVEHTTVQRLFSQPLHPYTSALLRSMPNLTHDSAGTLLEPIRGAMPAMHDLPKGCAFHPRCDFALNSQCTTTNIPLSEPSEHHWVRCVRLEPSKCERQT